MRVKIANKNPKLNLTLKIKQFKKSMPLHKKVKNYWNQDIRIKQRETQNQGLIIKKAKTSKLIQIQKANKKIKL